MPWYSSYDSDFNYDFAVTLDQAAGQVTYNYRPEPDLAGGEIPTELPGPSDPQGAVSEVRAARGNEGRTAP